MSLKKSLILLIIVILLSGCIPGDGKHTKEKPAGLLWGIWHGWLAPLSLIIGIFNSVVRVYEVNSSGWWYDFGFYIAIIGGFGGLSLSRKRKKKK
jgi:hypothetical protein